MQSIQIILLDVPKKLLIMITLTNQSIKPLNLKNVFFPTIINTIIIPLA